VLCPFAENGPGPAGNPGDTVMHPRGKMERQEIHAAMRAKMMEQQGKEEAYENPACNEPREGRMMEMNRLHGWNDMYSSHFHMMKRAMAALCLCMLLLCGAVNILLTILVILDMTKTGRFNGLWIPLLLLIGVPATGLYALFRIGDKLKPAEEKK
jgi:hypothetical protein